MDGNGVLQNPLVLAGLAVMQGAPMGQALTQAAQASQQAQYQKQQMAIQQQELAMKQAALKQAQAEYGQKKMFQSRFLQMLGGGEPIAPTGGAAPAMPAVDYSTPGGQSPMSGSAGYLPAVGGIKQGYGEFAGTNIDTSNGNIGDGTRVIGSTGQAAQPNPLLPMGGQKNWPMIGLMGEMAGADGAGQYATAMQSQQNRAEDRANKKADTADERRYEQEEKPLSAESARIISAADNAIKFSGRILPEIVNGKGGIDSNIMVQLKTGLSVGPKAKKAKDAINATKRNLITAITGAGYSKEEGVDFARMVDPQATDTEETYKARLAQIPEMMQPYLKLTGGDKRLGAQSGSPATSGAVSYEEYFK